MSFEGLNPSRCQGLASDLRARSRSLRSIESELRAIDASAMLAMAGLPSSLLTETADEVTMTATLLDAKALAMTTFDRRGTVDPGLEERSAAAFRRLEASLSDSVGDQKLAEKQRAETIRRYQLAAFTAAGIDPLGWVPSRGANANAANIEAVYTYYGQLYLNNPELEWAGMANMIGPSFAGGFYDLAMLRDLASKVGTVAEKMPPGTLPVDPKLVAAVAKMTDQELRFYETLFLDMQKQIFLDQATANQAYVDQGLNGVKALLDARFIDPKTYSAWVDIDTGKRTGNAVLISKGNEALLYREQRLIINDEYDQMYQRSPTGPAMTYLMTLVGSPSIPGAQAMAAVSPITFDATTPGPRRITTPESVGTPRSVLGWNIPSVSVGIPNLNVDNPTQFKATLITPFPDANVAKFDDRWKLIQQDTLPAFRKVLANPAQARAIAATPVNQRIEQYRLMNRIGNLLADLTTFEIEIEQ